ncbi:DUF1189 family protein [Mycoplasmatota bacterium WC44]
MIYDKIKNNIISPRKIYESRNDSLGKKILYIGFLVLLLLIPVTIDVISSEGLEPEEKRMLRNELKHQLDIDCEISDKLLCSDNSLVKIMSFDSFDIIVDPGSNYVTEGFTTKLVFTENNLVVLFAKNEVMQYSYEELPSDWQELKFDVESESFWDSVFGGVDELLVTYKSLWAISTILAFIFVYLLMIILEALVDTFIIRLFKYGRLSFKETFTIVTYSMTSYVIIRVILDLYGINYTGMALSFLQMIPLIYALISLRNAYRE